MPASAVRKVRARGPPLALRQVVHVAVLRVGAERVGEDARRRRCAACARRAPRCGSAARRRAAGCARPGRSRSTLMPRCLEERPHLALVGQHRLRLDQRRRAARAEDVVARSGCARPRRAPSARVRRCVARCARIPPGSRRGGVSVCSLIADASVRSSSHSGSALALAVALLAQVPQALVVEVDVVLRLDELRRGLGVVDALHAARSVQHLRDVDELERQPEPLGAALLVHQAGHVGGDDVLGAGLAVVAHLVVAHLRRHRLLEHRERAAEPAALVGPLRHHEARCPSPPTSRSCGFENGGSSISDMLRLAQRAQRRAAVVQPDLVRELGPREFARRRRCRAGTPPARRSVRAPARTSGVCGIAVRWSRTWWVQLPDGADDVVEAARSCGRTAPRSPRRPRGSRCWPSAARSRSGRADTSTSTPEALEQFQRGDADLGEERVDVAGDEQRDFHGVDSLRAPVARGCAQASTR